MPGSWIGEGAQGGSAEVGAGIERRIERRVEGIKPMTGLDGRSGQRWLVVLAFLGTVAAGCYQSYLDGRERCEPTPICLDGAVPVCLDELAAVDGFFSDDPACRSIEVMGTDDCSSTAGRIHIARRAEGATATWVEATVLEVPPGAEIGMLGPTAAPACTPCTRGIFGADPVPGHQFITDYGMPAGSVQDIELTLVGGGVRYRVVVCAHNDP